MIKRILLVLTVLSAALAWSGAAHAQGEDEYAAGIYSGRCDDIRDEVRTLDAPQFETGEWRGTEGAPRVLESDTDDIEDVPADEIFDTPHVLVVSVNEEFAACGEFGGLVGVEDDQDLAFGLRSVEDSGYTGVAIVEGVSFDEDDDEFEVSLYVVNPDDRFTGADTERD